jgi:hypothetical protein
VYEDLLSQAVALARIDRKKPKQANLRRAVSAAYYALFHYLVREACYAQIGTQHQQAAFRHVLARGYSHQVMKQACASFGGGTLKGSVKKGLPLNAAGQYAILKPIQEIAATFAELQEKRHLADYDLTERFERAEVLTLIEGVRDRIADFSSLPTSTDKSFFLACLWAWRELANR